MGFNPLSIGAAIVTKWGNVRGRDLPDRFNPLSIGAAIVTQKIGDESLARDRVSIPSQSGPLL